MPGQFNTRTPLQTWFYAIYLFVVTRHGVSGKELQRALGVTYKTAWRMGQLIRDLMAKADGFEMLQGHVELDEAYVGGHRPGKRGRGAAGKTIVMGAKERGGKINSCKRSVFMASDSVKYLTGLTDSGNPATSNNDAVAGFPRPRAPELDDSTARASCFT
jgi:hypothetical protein